MQQFFTDKIAKRFWSKVKILGQNDCWEWQAGRVKDGYGQFNPTHDKVIPAHRYSFFISGQKLKPGQVVMHSCDNPPCCNPAHLSGGTRKQNQQQMIARNRRCSPIGEVHPASRLKEKDVLAIRVAVASGKATQAAEAKKYGVSQVCISALVRRKTWKHL